MTKTGGVSSELIVGFSPIAELFAEVQAVGVQFVNRIEDGEQVSRVLVCSSQRDGKASKGCTMSE